MFRQKDKMIYKRDEAEWKRGKEGWTEHDSKLPVDWNALRSFAWGGFVLQNPSPYKQSNILGNRFALYRGKQEAWYYTYTPVHHAMK